VDLWLRGCPEAARFLEKHAGFMVTFAELAVESFVVPYSSNCVKMLMCEVVKRYKNKWMHWGTEGLRCMRGSIRIISATRYLWSISNSLFMKFPKYCSEYLKDTNNNNYFN
jgi:hypothetical protein